MSQRYAPYLQFRQPVLNPVVFPKFEQGVCIKTDQKPIVSPPSSIEKQMPNLSRFLQQLWIMINDPKIDCISWKGNNSFVVTNKEVFSNELLPKFFKHKKISSFVRQLNIYQFHKQKGKREMQWSHKYLIKGDYQALFKIRRRPTSQDTSKMQDFVKGLTEKIKEQQQKIQDIQGRVNAFEKDMKASGQLYVNMEYELFMIKDMLRMLCDSRGIRIPNNVSAALETNSTRGSYPYFFVLNGMNGTTPPVGYGKVTSHCQGWAGREYQGGHGELFAEPSRRRRIPTASPENLNLL